MGRLYLCKGSAAPDPFYLETMSRNIYSMEELSYLLMDNPYLIDKSLMGEELIAWIGEQTQDKELCEKLLSFDAEAPDSLYEYVTVLLRSNGFCNTRQLKEVQKALLAMAKMTGFEREKLRADKLWENEQYQSSILAYKSLLKSRSAKDQEKYMLGNVWHNMAGAYCGLFLYREAARCYEKAYSLNGKMESLRAMMMAVLSAGDEDLFGKLCRKYYLQERSADMLRSEYRKAMETENTRKFREKLDALDDLKEENYPRYQQAINEIITEWKEDYRRISRR